MSDLGYKLVGVSGLNTEDPCGRSLTVIAQLYWVKKKPAILQCLRVKVVNTSEKIILLVVNNI